MSAENTCFYEQIEERIGSFLTIKPTEKGQELVINPEKHTEFLSILKKFVPTDELSTEALSYLCFRCHLCNSYVHSENRDGQISYRINRQNYIGHNPDELLMTLKEYKPKIIIKKPLNIVVADDYQAFSTSLATSLADDGHHCYSISVHRDFPNKYIGLQILVDRVFQIHPDWYIGDKGLASIDGIEAHRRIRESGIQTIMVTGEMNTDETDQVAEFYIEKSGDILQKIISTLY